MYDDSENMEISSSNPFRGTWRRTDYFSPKGVRAAPEQLEKIVLWVQGESCYFVDIRIPSDSSSLDIADLLKKCSSFAGNTEYQPEGCLLKWNRHFDFRYPSQPDIGLMSTLVTGQLQEDDGLPGDDYREIWDKVDLSSEGDVQYNCTALVSAVNDQRGIFVCVDGWFALALGRCPSDAKNADLESFFSNDSDIADHLNTETIVSYALEHVTILGSTQTWDVKYALDPRMHALNLLSMLKPSCESPQDFRYLSALTFNMIHGVLPEPVARIQSIEPLSSPPQSLNSGVDGK